MLKALLAPLLILFSHSSFAGEMTPFANVAAPVPAADGSTQVLGFYSLGCIRGAKEIPVTSPTWEVVNVSRRRNYGHPDTLTFLKEFSDWSANSAKFGKLIVGDVSQPAGGPLPFGHASHQVGLDIDIRFRFADPGRTMSDATREGFPEVNVAEHKVVRDGSNYKLVSRLVEKEWKPQYAELLAKAASYERVERIFISPPIKQEMCRRYAVTDANGKKKYPPWLLKLSPYYEHTAHFHVRLSCPVSSPDCKKQDPVKYAANDVSKVGCAGDLMSWWTDTSNVKGSYMADAIEELQPKKPASPPELKFPKLPQECRDMVAGPAAPAPPVDGGAAASNTNR